MRVKMSGHSVRTSCGKDELDDDVPVVEDGAPKALSEFS